MHYHTTQNINDQYSPCINWIDINGTGKLWYHNIFFYVSLRKHLDSLDMNISICIPNSLVYRCKNA